MEAVSVDLNDTTNAHHETMTTYKITRGTISYGLYEAATPNSALDRMLADAGYESREDLPEHIDPEGFTVTEMTLKNGGARGTILVPVE